MFLKATVPCHGDVSFLSHPQCAALELAVSALFVKGIHTRSNGAKGHFHVQITASGVGELGMNSEAELFKKIPNIDELDQFQDLNDKWIELLVTELGGPAVVTRQNLQKPSDK